MKKCPFCNEEIQDGAIKCRYCKEWIGEIHSNEIIDDSQSKELAQVVSSASNNELGCSEGLSKKVALCSDCYSLLSPGSEFCSKCSVIQTDKIKYSAIKQKPIEDKNYISIFIKIVVFTLIAFMLMLIDVMMA